MFQVVIFLWKNGLLHELPWTLNTHPTLSALQLQVELPRGWTCRIWMNLAQMEVVMKTSLYSHPYMVSEDTGHQEFEKLKSRIME